MKMTAKLNESVMKAAELLRRSTAQVIFVTMIILAVYFAYGSLIYLFCACFIPGFVGDSFKDIILPGSFSPEVILIILAGAMIGYMLITPLSFGADWCFYQAANGRQIPLECLFTCVIDKYRRRKVWIVNVVSTGSRMLIAISCAALVRAFATAYEQAAESGSGAGVFALMYSGTGILSAFLLIAYFLLSIRYFMVPYVFADSPDMDVRMMLSRAVNIAEKHRREIIILWLLYLPMYALCIFGFPFLAVLPAVRAMNAVCAARFAAEWESAVSDADAAV